MGNGKPGSSGHGVGLSPSHRSVDGSTRALGRVLPVGLRVPTSSVAPAGPRAHPSRSEEILPIPALHGSGCESHHPLHPTPRCSQSFVLSARPGQSSPPGCHQPDGTGDCRTAHRGWAAPAVVTSGPHRHAGSQQVQDGGVGLQHRSWLRF